MNKRLLVGSLLLVIALTFLGAGENVEAVSGCNIDFTAGYKTITTTVDGRTLEIGVWYPSRAAEVATNYGLERKLGVGKAATGAAGATDCRPYPVIVFSHGFHGCAWQSLFLTEALAKAGYVVFAPNHQDAVCGGGGSLLDVVDIPGFRKFKQPETWSDQTYADRRVDMRAALDEAFKLNATAGSFLFNQVSKTEVGLLGHSLGGYTGFGLAGAWPSWLDSRFKALVALSPVSEPYLIKGAIDQIKIPVMLQGGTLDSTITPDFVQLYPAIKSPKVEVVLSDAGHLAWSNTFCRNFTDSRNCLSGDNRIKAIVAYTTAFFDRFLQADQTATAKLTTKMLGVYSLKSDLGKAPTPPAPASTTSSATSTIAATSSEVTTTGSQLPFPRPLWIILAALAVFIIYRFIRTEDPPKI